jgi:hypothetical protein
MLRLTLSRLGAGEVVGPGVRAAVRPNLGTGHLGHATGADPFATEFSLSQCVVAIGLLFSPDRAVLELVIAIKFHDARVTRSYELAARFTGLL